MSAARVAFQLCHNIISGEPHRGAINLDGLTPIELEIAASCKELHPRVREYASTAVKARSERLKGNITLAITWERHLDRVYSNIPASLIW